MKVMIDYEEWYPVWCFEQPDREDCETFDVPEEQVARWRKVFDDFEAVQVELQNVFDAYFASLAFAEYAYGESP